MLAASIDGDLDGDLDDDLDDAIACARRRRIREDLT